MAAICDELQQRGFTNDLGGVSALLARLEEEFGRVRDAFERESALI